MRASASQEVIEDNQNRTSVLLRGSLLVSRQRNISFKPLITLELERDGASL